MMMIKTTSITCALLLANAAFVSAFTPALPQQRFSASTVAPSSSRADGIHTALNLFGDADKEGADGGKKQPGMFDQLAMFKKAQEIAGKKKEIEKELSAMEFQGKGADDKVTVSMQYVASKNPIDPQPEYVVSNIDFDQEYFDGASPEDLSAAVKEAYQNSIVETKLKSEEKFASLAEDLKEIMGSAAPVAEQPSE